MPRAKLSGALLVRKDARTPTTPAQDLDTMSNDADAKALGSPVLVWSAALQDEAEPNTAKDTMPAVHRAAPVPQAVYLDPPVIGVIAGMVSQSDRLDGRASAFRRTVFPAVAVAVSVLAIGSVSGSFFLPLNGGKISTETALSVAPQTVTEKLTSRGVEPEPQPPEIAATEVPSRGAPDSAAANAAPAAAAPHEALPDHPSTGAPGAVRMVSLPDPAAPDDASRPVPRGSGATPSATLSVSTANSGTAPAESPGSAALNSALLARGDALLVIGDFSAARMFYERAANAGHGQAALRLGETHDPAFLARTGFIGARANAAIAAYWYQRARELDVPEANILLRAIATEAGYSSP